jgi:hypothetical protein
MGEVSQRIAGTFVLDEPVDRPPVSRWVQEELRGTRWQGALDAFARAQPETLNMRLIQLEELRPDCLVCRVPCCLTDHESPHPFRSEVVLELNPVTGEISRRN